jgi:excisionase family DNA binding protein
MSPVIDRLLTLEEAADRLGTKPRFTRRLVAERRIRFTRVGRHIRIPESALREFIDAGMVQPVTAWANRRSRKAA